MEDYAGPCFIIGSILVIASLIVQNAGNMSLVFQRNSFGQAEVVVSDKKQELLRIESPFLIRKYVQEEPTGARGPARTMPSIYVVFVDKSENILLTLKMNMGLAPIQPDFMEVPLGTVQGNPIFTCSKLRQINAVLNELALEPLQQNATPV